MPPDPEVDEDYESAEDSDFAPDDAPDRASSPDSDDDAEAGPGKPAEGAKRKRAAGEADAEDAGFENSGDEAIIEKGNKRRKKAKPGVDLDADGGEESLIKTRSQRAQEKVERKAAIAQGPVTIDVDAMWSQMMAGPTSKPQESEDADAMEGLSSADKNAENSASKSNGQEPSELIKIKRTYNFAGKVHTEEKMVARDSAEAKLYLASLGDQAEPNADDEPPKRMPRKAFRSAFEPVIDQFQRADLNLGMSVRLQARDLAKDAKKLTTVEKSRMDWAGFVDKEGIKDELALAGKSKDSYAERQTFLARSEAKREEESRRARAAARA